MKRWGALTLVLLAFGTVAGDAEEDVPWPDLRKDAELYLKHCSTPDDVQRREDKFRQQVAQRMEDNPDVSEDSAMRALMLDWAAGARKKLKAKEPDAVVQVCMLFVKFLDRGYELPGLMRKELTPKLVREIREFLQQSVEKARNK